ncbi:hypothetical protein N7280_06505 [Rickettsia rhipicephali]|uniref:hypothetical protein n=1 Tax=Rickettsia rhipicephali TaxID=33992 RepID=UPI002253ACA1|nr:hypothetical protein [Rickettsia rhipicephali]MCX4080220.1 hypothetical protein [Rickettsia rhipicephali]
MKGYDSIKCNVVFGSATSNIQLGNLEKAEKNIQMMEDMFNQNLVDLNYLISKVKIMKH